MPRQMALVMTFWLALSLPGYTVMRRWFPDVLAGGLLSTVALSYLASFALLSPIAVGAYLSHVPVGVFSGAIVLAVVASAVLLARDLFLYFESARPRWSWPSPIALCAVAIVINDALSGLSIGSPLNGDAHYHVARIRQIVDSGFNSWDPLVSGRFDATYHTNLYHAMMAAACPLTGLQPADVWVGTLFFAKLFAAGSIYHLAWVVFGQRWPAAIAAAVFAVSAAGGWWLVYLNNLSMYGPLALALAFALQLLSGEGEPRRAVLGLCVVLLLLPQFHGMAYVFAAFTLTPLLLGRLAFLRLRQRPGRRELLLPLLCIALAGVWLVPHVEGRVEAVVSAAAAKVEGARAPTLAQAAAAAVPAPRERRLMYKNFIELPDGRLRYDPAVLFDLAGEPAQLIMGLALGLLSRRRRVPFALLAAATALVVVTLLVPTLCTVAFRAFGAGWKLTRMLGGLSCMQAALVPATGLWLLAEWLEPLARRLPALPARGARALGPLVGLAIAFVFVHHTSRAQARWPWREHWNTGVAAVTVSRTRRLDEMRKFYGSAVEPGALLVVPLEQVPNLMMTCNCYPLAVPADRGEYGMPDMWQRRLDLRRLYGSKLTLEERLQILRRYDARHILITSYWKPEQRALRELYAPIVAQQTWGGASVLYRVSLDPWPPAVPH
jgi:hypothetical protein